MTMRFLRGVALLAALFSATPVLALDNGCLLDHCEDKARDGRSLLQTLRRHSA